jgi:hypothetical protein
MDPARTTSDGFPARYAAVVEALLGVRTDYAGARYDAAVDAALATHRLDLDTARELRWWQRASVRAAQEYAATLVPQVLAACERVDTEAAADAAELATSWQQATVVLAGAAPAPAHDTETDSDAPDAEQTRPAIRWNAPTRLIAVPDTRHTPRTLPTRASVEETQRAVRAALRSISIDLDDAAGGAARADRAPGTGKDERHHAHSASAS